jgi:Domain of unknown function (DUF4349)
MRFARLIARLWERRVAIGVIAAVVPFLLAVVLLFGGGRINRILSVVGSSVNLGGSSVGSTDGGGSTAQGAGSGADQASGGSRSQVFDAARPDLLVIKTGTLDLQVLDVGKAIASAASTIVDLGGYVSGSHQDGDGDHTVATITYRLPAMQWEDALAALRSQATRVVGEETKTEDVTGQVVDLGARITNLRATEAALQAIMAKATKISDVLDVQDELTRVRGDIEQASAEQQHLQEQAAFSTLSVRFALKPAPAVVVSQQGYDPRVEVDRASAQLIEIVQAVETAGIWFGIVWLPVLVGLGLVFGTVALLARRRLWPLVAMTAAAGDGGWLPPRAVNPTAPRPDATRPPEADDRD